MYPWPSFGGFLFYREETPIFQTDQGWVNSPSYSRQRPLGSGSDVISALAIGSAERTFEVYLTPQRFNGLLMLLNSKGLFTDWDKPVPGSRMAFLSEIVPIEEAFGIQPTGLTQRKRRVRLTFVSA